MTKLAKPPLELKKRQLSKKQEQLSNFALGKNGELQAILFLKNKNYTILENNIRLKNSEIDIIAQDNDHNEIVFVEVKTRKTEAFGHPSLAVNRKKIWSMNQVAQAWLQKHNLAKDYRFDIISVVIKSGTQVDPAIEHFENITFLGM